MISRFPVFLLLILSVTAASAGETSTSQDSKINVQLGGASSNAKDNSSGWNTSLRGKQPEDDGEGVEPGPSELTMTVYDRRRGRGKGFGPVVDDRGRRMEMDVTSELETCPDGNTRVKAVRIGAWRYRVDGSCEDFRRGGHISVDLGGGNTMITTRADASKSPDEEPKLRCDSSSWTCRME